MKKNFVSEIRDSISDDIFDFHLFIVNSVLQIRLRDPESGIEISRSEIRDEKSRSEIQEKHS
jgi:hypothetical protein